MTSRLEVLGGGNVSAETVCAKEAVNEEQANGAVNSKCLKRALCKRPMAYAGPSIEAAADSGVQPNVNT